MSHYFTDNSDLSHNRKEISFRFSGNLYTFITDNGVFSKTEVDFGSYVLLKTLSDKELGDHILDMGCGYGVISIVLKSFNKEAIVEGVDVNPRAVQLSKENATLNGEDVEYYESDGFSKVKGTYSAIITNPPIRAGKKVIYDMFEKSLHFLGDNGTLWVVIRKQQGALSALKYISSIYGNCEIVAKEKGYLVLKATKMN